MAIKIERGGWVHPLMLGLECVEADNARATWEFIEGSVAFPQSDSVLLGNLGEKFSKAPNTALVKGIA